MALNYYAAYNAVRTEHPKASYYEDYDAILDFSFDNASNVVYDEVEYEQTYGENDFKTIGRVRVDTILDFNTGIILGDDYKMLLFPPEFKVEPYYGMKFRWKGSYWLVINTNSYGSLQNTAEIRRCNNVLRFFGKKGERLYEPCILDYTLRFANNEDTKTIIVGNGEQKVWCQRNKRTTLLRPNDRFLFGPPEQRVAFRIYGGGTKNYLNSVTDDDNSPTLTEFYVDHYEVNPLFDDFENGFADAYLNEVRINIDNDINKINVGDKIKLQASVFKGEMEINFEDIEWTSSDEEIISIEDGYAIGIGVGKASIIASIFDATITSKTEIEVTDDEVEDYYEIIINPDINYVLQDESQIFEVYLYKNGNKQDNIFDFSDISEGVPVNNYELIDVNNNSFTLKNNKMFMKNPVVIRCSCDYGSIDFEIMLRGVY